MGKSGTSCARIQIKKTFLKILIFNIYLLSSLFASAHAQPDLTIQEVTLVTQDLHQGDLALVRVKIVNNGNSPAESFSVDLFTNAKSLASVNGKRGDLTYLAKRLGDGESLQIDFVFKAYGSLKLYASVDPFGQIPETNDSNNTSGPVVVDVGEAIDDDVYEENDTYDKAKNLSLVNQGWVSYSLSSKDSDYYKVSASAGQSLVFKLYDYKNDNSNLELYLLDSAGNILRASESVYDQEKITFRVSSSGNYIVWVKPGVNPSKYILSAFRGSLPDIEIATEVEIIKKYYDKDGNVYHPPSNNGNNPLPPFPEGVDLAYANHFTINLKNSGRTLKPGEDFYIDLFRNTSWPPKFGDFGNMSPLRIKYSDFDQNGEYTIEIEDPRLTAGQYKYYFLLDSEGALEEINRVNNIHGKSVIVGTSSELKIVDDAFENTADRENDRHPNAPNPPYDPETMTISDYNALNAPYYTRAQYIQKIRIAPGRHTNLKAFDDDFYVVSVLPNSVVILDLEYRIALGNLDLKVYTLTSLSPIKSSATGSNKETIILRNNSNSNKDYVVHVIPRQVNSAYTLNVKSYKRTPDVDLQITSIVQHAQTAKGIPLTITYKNNGSVSISDTRVDVFANTVNTAPVIGELSDYFFNSGPIGAGQKVVTDITIPITSGTYYLFGIIDSSDHIAESYEDNNIHKSGSVNGQNTISDDAIEKSKLGENDSIETASALNIGQYRNLRTLDDDWYKVEVGPGQNLRSDILFSHVHGDLDLEMYTLHTVNSNPVKTMMSSGVSQNDNEYAEYSNTSSAVQTIYVRVFSRNEANGYNLYFQLTPNNDYLPDLTVSSVLTSPLTSPEGTMVRTTLVVENRGDKDISSSDTIFVDLFLTQNKRKPTMGEFGDYFTVLTDGLNVGEKLILSFEYRLPTGDYQVHAVVDTENRITERDETNNKLSAQLLNSIGGSGPDLSLTITSVVKPTNQSDPIIVNATVTNNGQTPVSGFSVGSELLDQSGLRNLSVSKWPDVTFTNVLSEGQSTQITLELFLDEYTATGAYDLAVDVDPLNRITETNEENNSAVHPSLALTGQTPVYIETFRPYLKNARSVDTSIELYVQDPNNNLIMIRSNDDSDGIYSALKVGLPPGKYYVRVSSYESGTLGDYNLFINTSARSGLEKSSVTPPDTAEPNNDKFSAKIYTLSKEIIQHQSLDGPGPSGAIDVDWIYFVIP